MWLVAAFACSEDPEGEPTSPPGDTAEAPAADPALGAEILPFPDCAQGPPDGRLDVEAACVDGVCIGQTADEAASAYGTTPYCLPLSAGSTSCFYGEFVFASFTDADLDAVPDDGKRAYLVQVFDGWPGGSDDGLSVGISPACWVEALGPADLVSLVAADAGYHAVSLTWDAYYLTVSDQQDEAFQFVPDGVVEQIAFHNGVYGP